MNAGPTTFSLRYSSEAAYATFTVPDGMAPSALRVLAGEACAAAPDVTTANATHAIAAGRASRARTEGKNPMGRR